MGLFLKYHSHVVASKGFKGSMPRLTLKTNITKNKVAGNELLRRVSAELHAKHSAVLNVKTNVECIVVCT